MEGQDSVTSATSDMTYEVEDQVIIRKELVFTQAIATPEPLQLVSYLPHTVVDNTWMVLIWLATI